MKMIIPALAAACFLVPSAAQAATKTSNMAVSMTVTANCTVTAGMVAFGSQGALDSIIDQTGTFSVTCSNTTPYSIGMDGGANGGSTSSRRMKNVSTADTIGYALYLNATRTNNWGSTIGGDTLSGTGNGAAQTITVYGRVPAQTSVPPGNYSDTVTLTVTY